MDTAVLFRKSLAEEGEYEVCRQYFDIYTNRTLLKEKLVIGRFSVLPYYRELEEDLSYNNCRLINLFSQHQYIANFDYYYDVVGLTPKSWDQDSFPNAPEGKYVVKGRTNSRKFDWKTKMFANSKREAIEIGIELLKDLSLTDQGIIYREYIRLQTFKEGINNLPFTNEWRLFFLGNELLSYGYYWSMLDEELVPKSINSKIITFAKDIANIIKDNVNFFVLDIAIKEDGDPILIEINDGQMSGLSLNNPRILYNNLKIAIKEQNFC